MKLHWSPRSPFVRKVMILAHERGIADRLTLLRSVALVTEPNPEILQDNPLGTIPALVLDDGTALYDSRVICTYLDTLVGGTRMEPEETAGRLLALRRQALGDGFLDLLLVWRHERERPEAARSAERLRAFSIKAASVLDALEAEAPGLEATRFGIGHIAIGCALGYLDFRFADLSWREGRPRTAAWHAAFEARPSARATVVSTDA